MRPLGTLGIEQAKQQILQAVRILCDDSGFEACAARFQKFLKENNYPENMVWLMPEDVLLSGKRFFYVRVPIPDTNQTNARNIYDQGMARGRGVLMSTICEMGASTCCYVWFPRLPEEEPQGVWPRDGSVKFSAKMDTSRVTGKPIKSHLLWTFLKSRHRDKQKLKDFLFT